MTKIKSFSFEGKVTTMTVTNTETVLDVVTDEERSLEDFAEALAELDINKDLADAGYALVMWAGPDCPWFVAGPKGPTDTDVMWSKRTAA